ncbi:hypothetical protein CLU82_3617 [Flavobacterium sp. 5]|nr:hypothetical protein CLU82_3617 [Flavobacterium sp. 5]
MDTKKTIIFLSTTFFIFENLVFFKASKKIKKINKTNKKNKKNTTKNEELLMSKNIICYLICKVNVSGLDLNLCFLSAGVRLLPELYLIPTLSK